MNGLNEEAGPRTTDGDTKAERIEVCWSAAQKRDYLSLSTSAGKWGFPKTMIIDLCV